MNRSDLSPIASYSLHIILLNYVGKCQYHQVHRLETDRIDTQKDKCLFKVLSQIHKDTCVSIQQRSELSQNNINIIILQSVNEHN